MLDLVGKLRYLADRTRPDLLFAASVLRSAAPNPCPEHIKAAERVILYLKGTVDFRLVLGGPGGS